MYKNWGKFFLQKKMFLMGGNEPEIWDLGIFQRFLHFFWVAKNQIHFDNTFNVYSYLKYTRKELSDGTLMLKKNNI